MMFVASFPRLKHIRMSVTFVRFATLAAVCCVTTSLYEYEQLTRTKQGIVTIHRSLVLVENLNVELYMAAERGFIAKAKPSDTFDGQTKTFEDFQFHMQNTLTYTAMTARGGMERGAAQVMMTILERGGRMTLDESKNLVLQARRKSRSKRRLLTTCCSRSWR